MAICCEHGNEHKFCIKHVYFFAQPSKFNLFRTVPLAFICVIYYAYNSKPQVHFWNLNSSVDIVIRL